MVRRPPGHGRMSRQGGDRFDGGEGIDTAVYAGRRKMPEPARHFTRQALHAHRLGLIHPESRRPLQWDAPMPEDMLALLAALRRAEGRAKQ